MSPTIPGRRLTLPVPPGLKVIDECSGRIIRAITVDLSFLVETDLSSESYQSSPERPSPGSVGDTPGCIPDHRGNESDGESSVSTDLSSEDYPNESIYFTPSWDPCHDNSKTTQFLRYDSRSVKSENDVERLENPDNGSTESGDSIYETPLGLQNSAIKRLFEYESRLTSADSPVSGIVNNSDMCECSFEDTSFHERRDSEIGNAVNMRPAYNLPANANSHASEFKYSHEESAQFIPSVKLEPGIDPPVLSFFCHSLSMDMEHLVAKSPQITAPHDVTVNERSPAKKAKILDENHNILNDPETLPGNGTESGILDSNALGEADVFDSPGVEKGNDTDMHEVHLSQVLVAETVMNVDTESGCSLENRTGAIEEGVDETLPESESLHLEDRPRKSPKSRFKIEPGIDAQVSITDNLTTVSCIEVSTPSPLEVDAQVVSTLQLSEPESSAKKAKQLDENHNIVEARSQFGNLKWEEDVETKRSPSIHRNLSHNARKTASANFIQCEYCSFLAANKTLLKYHRIRMHTKSRVSKCSNEGCCYASYADKPRNFREHQKTCDAKRTTSKSDNASTLNPAIF